MKEQWKAVVGYEGLYIASNLGNVKSISKNLIMSQNRCEKDGYSIVRLSKDGKKKNLFAHRVILSAFIRNTLNKRTINHKNLNKKDNRLSNLEWATDRENALHYWKSKRN